MNPSRRPRPRGRLARLGFGDAGRAVQLLGGGGLDLLDDGGLPRDAGSERLVEALGGAPDPDLACLALERLLRAQPDSGERDALLGALRDDAGVRRRLPRLLGTSVALGDHLTRHPEQWTEVAAADGSTRPTPEALRRRLLEAVGADPDDPPRGTAGSRAGGDGTDVLDALRVAHRRSLLGLVGRDLDGLDVADVSGELADLAAATVEAGLAVAAAALPPDAPGCRLAVVGLGKCGGRELNYASDVDVLLLAEPEDGAEEQAALAVGTRLAHGLVRAVSATTAEGFVWPLDLALRPEGRDGAVVRTLLGATTYYRRWARTWEFQALLKARPLAGDRALAGAFDDAVRPGVWTASRRDGFVDDVRQTRRRVEAQVPFAERDRQVKTGVGGLRDVEFAVQMLQLVHGAADPSLRSPGTLAALDALARGGYVGREDARRFAEAYRWLRRLEHHLQLRHLRRATVVPVDPEQLRVLARSLDVVGRDGRDAGEELAGYLSRVRALVRRLHVKLFTAPLLAATARVPAELATDLRLGRPAAAERLGALGFSDGRRALAHVAELSDGVSRRAALQRALLPSLLMTLADGPDPDEALLSYRRVSDALGATPWFLRLLRDGGEGDAPGVERLARVLGSRYAADLLTRAPDAVALVADPGALAPKDADSLSEELRATAARHHDAASAVRALRALRRRELVRVAVHDVLGPPDHPRVMRALSDVTTATLQATLDVARREVEEADGGRRADVVLVVAGNTGGWEAGYGSDVDAFAVHAPTEGTSSAAAQRAAEQVVGRVVQLLGLPGPDPPLRLDTQLRPDGRAGALSRSIDGLTRYWEGSGQVWEAQALLRARPVAGPSDVRERFLAVVDPVRYPADGLSADAVEQVRHMKRRVETERLPRSADRRRHLKLGPGGLSDVDWTVQLLALRSAGRMPALRTPSTRSAIRAAGDAGLLEDADARVLAQAWALCARLRDALVLVTGRVADVLPASGPALDGVAHLLGYGAATGPSGVGEHHAEVTTRCRAVVERVFGT